MHSLFYSTESMERTRILLIFLYKDERACGNWIDPFLSMSAICLNDYRCSFSWRVRTEDGNGLCAWVVTSTSGVKSLLIYATGLICMRHLEYFSCMSRMGFCLSDAAVYFQPS